MHEIHTSAKEQKSCILGWSIILQLVFGLDVVINIHSKLILATIIVFTIDKNYY